MRRVAAGELRAFLFAPDEHANYGLLVAALDGAKQAGATVLGVTTDPAPLVAPEAPSAPAVAPSPRPKPAPAHKRHIP